MMKRSICICLLLSIAISATTFAQSVTKTQLGAHIKVNTTSIDIQFYAPSIVRIIKTPG